MHTKSEIKIGKTTTIQRKNKKKTIKTLNPWFVACDSVPKEIEEALHKRLEVEQW